MRRTHKVVLGLTALALLAMPVASSFAANMAGAVLGQNTDQTDKFAGACAKSRVWVGTSPDRISPTSVNCNAAAGRCATVQFTGNCNPPNPNCGMCDRGFNSNTQGSGRPGYFSEQENGSGSTTFPGTSSGDPAYVLFEHIQNPGGPNYISYYHLTGQKSITSESGKTVDDGCLGTVLLSCFLPGTPTRHAPDQLGTRADNDAVTPGGQLRSVDGWSATPSPRVASIAGPNVNLGWDAAAYFDKNGAPSPILGYLLYRTIDNNGNGLCEPPAENDPGWTVRGFVPGTTATDVQPPFGGSEDCAFYALRLVVDGPDAVASGPDATTGQITGLFKGASGPGAKINPAAVVVANFNAKYAGKNTFDIGWTVGSESGINGYYVARATSASGPFERIGGLVQATGDGSSYSVLDKVTRAMGTTFYYQLQVANTDGTTTNYSNLAVGDLVKKK
jgi:hypothetical protein